MRNTWQPRRESSEKSTWPTHETPLAYSNRDRQIKIADLGSPAPSLDNAADWLDATVKEAAWVYRDTARLWLTTRKLFETGEIVLTTLGRDDPAPTHARCLVDVVYEGDSELPTEGLRKA